MFIDLAKAVDIDPHNRLLRKLSCLRIPAIVLSPSASSLTDRYWSFPLHICASSLNTVLSGVPQENVIGPLHFFILINDLPYNLSSTVRFFGDGGIIDPKLTGPGHRATFYEDLNKVPHTWCLKW